MNRWILVGSLGAVFLFTLGFSYGPGYGGRLSAFLGAKTSISPEVSSSNMVTPVVTSKQVVTLKNVTNVTSMSPLIYNDSQYVSMSPLVSPVTSRTPTMSPSPSAIHSVSPSRTPTPMATLQPASQSSQPLVSPSPAETPVSTLLPTSTPTPTFSPQSSKININTAGLSALGKIICVCSFIAPNNHYYN